MNKIFFTFLFLALPLLGHAQQQSAAAKARAEQWKQEELERQEELKKLNEQVAETTPRIKGTIEQGGVIKGKEDNSNVTQGQVEVTTDTVFIDRRLELGGRAHLGQNAGVSHKLEGSGVLLARLLLSEGNFRSSMEFFVGAGYDQLAGVNTQFGVGFTLGLCSSKESEKKEWVLCWMNDGKIAAMASQQLNTPGKLEFVSALEVQKDVGGNVRIFAGPRASAVLHSQGDKDQTIAGAVQVTGALTVQWDAPKSKTKSK